MSLSFLRFELCMTNINYLKVKKCSLSYVLFRLYFVDLGILHFVEEAGILQNHTDYAMDHWLYA